MFVFLNLKKEAYTLWKDVLGELERKSHINMLVSHRGQFHVVLTVDITNLISTKKKKSKK